MKKIFLIFSIFLSFNYGYLFPQSQKIMTYNLLNYPGTTASIRNPYFSTVISNTNPDILVVQEITSKAGVTGFLNNVLLPIDATYSAGTFIDGPDTDNAVFFKSSVFNFISNTPISTALRDINEFRLNHIAKNAQIIIYSVHLKASEGSSNELQRAAEVDSLRQITDALPPGSNFIVLGDFNIYSSNELAYQKLISTSTPGYFIDAQPITGTWNNPAYSQYHTQSTRTRQFGGGATGGLDDRFDMILFSQEVWNMEGISYIPDSIIPFGNDGIHYNDSINKPPNNAVSQQVADALHYSSDHLPVLATLYFDYIIPVELTTFYATVTDANVTLNWQTATELNNYGFNIERTVISSDARDLQWNQIAFVPGNGTTNEFHSYQYKDTDLSAGKYQYRLKQIDNNGQYKYSPTVEVVILPQQFTLYQNYPNPFNPSTTISYEIPNVISTEGRNLFVTLKIYDVLGNEVATLVNEQQQPGFYKVEFNASNLSSGMYFYALQTNNQTLTNKMILIK